MIRLIDICMYWAMLVLYSYINIIEYVKNPLPILSLSPVYASVVSDTVIRSILYTSDPITNWNDHSITKVIERTESSGKGQLLLFFFSVRTITAGVMYTKRLKHLVRHRHIHIQLSHPKIYHQSINQSNNRLYQFNQNIDNYTKNLKKWHCHTYFYSNIFFCSMIFEKNGPLCLLRFTRLWNARAFFCWEKKKKIHALKSTICFSSHER